LEVEGRIDSVIVLNEAPGATIPDNDPNGIERTLQVTETGTVKEISVFVDVTHTYIRDLAITLVSSAGTFVPLHNRTGGSTDNIITTYTAATTPELMNLSGEPVEGAWKLRAADLEGLDVGKLNKWELKIVLET
jgi:subtilisin-like proprotein convertase family protein